MDLPVLYDNIHPAERWKVREEYIALQNGLCYFCNNSLYGPPGEKGATPNVNHRLFPDGFFQHPIHLHHNHVTGLTLGAVHARCNAVLWQHYHE